MLRRSQTPKPTSVTRFKSLSNATPMSLLTSTNGPSLRSQRRSSRRTFTLLPVHELLPGLFIALHLVPRPLPLPSYLAPTAAQQLVPKSNRSHRSNKSNRIPLHPQLQARALALVPAPAQVVWTLMPKRLSTPIIIIALSRTRTPLFGMTLLLSTLLPTQPVAFSNTLVVHTVRTWPLVMAVSTRQSLPGTTKLINITSTTLAFRYFFTLSETRLMIIGSYWSLYSSCLEEFTETRLCFYPLQYRKHSRSISHVRIFPSWKRYRYFLSQNLITNNRAIPRERFLNFLNQSSSLVKTAGSRDVAERKISISFVCIFAVIFPWTIFFFILVFIYYLSVLVLISERRWSVIVCFWESIYLMYCFLQKGFHSRLYHHLGVESAISLF